MASLRMAKGTKSQIDNIPMIDGQILIDTEHRHMYLDTLDENNNELKRVLMGSLDGATPVVTYTITYNGNGATSGSTTSQTKIQGESIQLRSNGFTKTGYVFKEWNTASNGTGTSYDEGDTYSTDADLTLYAIWEEEPPVPTNSVVVAFENENDSNWDVLILSETSMSGATSVNYANHTYYYIERQDQDPSDYSQYNLDLYETNTYYGHDAASRGELAYIIFDGEIEENYSFTHSSSQYITGLFIQPIITAENEISFRYYSNNDWETTPRGYNQVDFTVTSNTSPVYFVSVATTNHNFVAISENSFTYHVVNTEYAANGSYLYKQEWNVTGDSITRNDITYYAKDFFVGSYDKLDKCSLKPTQVTSSSSWSNDQKWELAFIVFDGSVTSTVTIASHFTDSNITGIWVQPIIINLVDILSSNRSLPNNNLNLLGSAIPRTRALFTPTPLRTSSINVSDIKIESRDGHIQIYNPYESRWEDLYSVVSKEQIIKVEDNVAPKFTFDVLDIKYPQKAEIFTSVNGIKPDTITYTTIADIPDKMDITFPTFDSGTYGNIGALTCKVYFNSPTQVIVNEDAWEEVSEIPFNFYPNGSAVEYNNKLHIFYQTNHYSWDGTDWVQESTIPYSFDNGGVIVYQNKIHIFGSNGINNKHYSWDGTEWTQETNTPNYFAGKDRIVLFDNKVCLVSSGMGTTSQGDYIHMWNGSSWSSVAIPYGSNSIYNQSEVLNGYIHILGMSSDYTKCYKYDGTNFSEDVTIIANDAYASTVSYNGKIHVIGGASGLIRQHLIFDGTQWSSLNSLPYDFQGMAVVYKGRIHILGATSSTANAKNHYRWKGL